ncbi:MAG: metallophosphoesterase [Ignavibacteriae bacterium HGW-Ignavibacteriae-3]|nr:MAG: metallophosphoesterase [Ignavibacteriae bacterium HGW-Ignavibacteriae-3]
MKLTQQIIFFGIVFTVYGLINFYIIRRGLSAIPDSYKSLFIYSVVFAAVSFIAGRILENVWISFVSEFLIWIGSFWIAIMFYLLLSILIIDLFRLVNFIVPIFPAFITENIQKSRQITALIVSVLVLITVAGGYINTKMIITKTYKIKIDKAAGELKKLNVVMASDLHLGAILGRSFLNNVVQKINALQPDIILLAGDIIDEDLAPVIKNNVGEELKLLKSKYGVYAITGNHEYIGGVEAACKYLADHKVNVLRDSTVMIDSSFYVVGREDRSIRQFSGGRRKDLKEIIGGIDKSYPLILMDHQPFGLNDALDNGIDLQLSGHTHNGQLWPLNYIVEKIYELAWGYKINRNTRYYVSCGVGGWGPPIRTGSRPEIINFKISFGAR